MVHFPGHRQSDRVMALSLLALLVVSAFLCCPALAALTGQSAVQAIRDAQVLAPSIGIQAVVRGQEVIVTTYSHPKATGQDLKIDAMLITKALMDAQTEGLVRVKVFFYGGPGSTKFRQAVVRTSDVQAFGSRLVSQEDLLSSIELIEGDTRQKEGILDGIYKADRIKLLSRIEHLSELGVGVSDQRAELKAIEDLVRANADKDNIVLAMNELIAKLNELENNYNRAQGLTPAEEKSQPDKPVAGSKADRQAATVRSPETEARTGRSPGGVDYEAVERELGNLAPRPGPFYRQRYQVARRIRDLKLEGKTGLELYLSLYREVEESALRGDMGLLKLKLKQTMHKLSMPAFIR